MLMMVCIDLHEGYKEEQDPRRNGREQERSWSHQIKRSTHQEQGHREDQRKMNSNRIEKNKGQILTDDA